jgi:predicted O-methyltransferase YrrM
MLATIKRAAKESIDSLPAPLGRLVCAVIERCKTTDAERRGQQSALSIQRRLGCESTVVSGPFTGMRYLTDLRGGAWLPKVLGTYEMEMAPAVEQCIAEQPDAVVDIGAAEGYYAVGMALRIRAARVVCYEYYPPARQLLNRMACQNGVRSRLEIRSECTVERLRTTLQAAKRWLVISDCEGAEDELLDPAIVPALRQASLLIETHDVFRPGVTERLRARFAPTHHITIIPARDRVLDDFPLARDALPAQELIAAMNEAKHSDMEWMHLKPRETA